jgi:hypothetical protein
LLTAKVTGVYNMCRINPLKPEPRREREREMGKIDEEYIKRGNQGVK